MLHISPKDHTQTVRVVHHSHRQTHVKPVSQTLHVVTVVSNPERFYSRYKNYRAFEKHIEESGAVLYTVEVAFRDRHFEVTNHENPHHIQLRSKNELWLKESGCNVGISRFDPGWQYGSYIDADFSFTRTDWVTETIHQLQHFQWVQLFDFYADLQSDHSIKPPMPSFAQVFLNGGDTSRSYYRGKLWGAPGGAWAFRREAFDLCGGLLDTCVLGSADYHMAVGLSGEFNKHIEFMQGTPGYLRSLREWADRAKAIKRNIGVVNNFAIHAWHGSRYKRGYKTRSSILTEHGYDPYSDVSKDWQGLIRFNGNKPDLEYAIRDYFRSRDEDECSIF